jgi:hypothetical protein
MMTVPMTWNVFTICPVDEGLTVDGLPQGVL